MLLLVLNSLRSNFLSLPLGEKKNSQISWTGYIKLDRGLCHFSFDGITLRRMDKWFPPTVSSFLTPAFIIKLSHQFLLPLYCLCWEDLIAQSWGIKFQVFLYLFPEASAILEKCQFSYTFCQLLSIHPQWAIIWLFPMISFLVTFYTHTIFPKRVCCMLNFMVEWISAAELVH